ncbi:hypothetical protein SAMN04488052_10882 [Aquisalimonas asiatica]|uniref:Outer membrane protein beta-barrel domain-containing protein n=1 Tax=Aquisalimonas asiatica TaxID=406100 RepID=A0A1H8UV97_9GAMM|nr:hypothetical protein SAMN04488052_10882 [Aquisalimonas asiatica]
MMLLLTRLRSASPPVLLSALLALAAASLPGALSADEVPRVEMDPPESSVTSRWGVGVAHGVQWYADEDDGNGESGTVNAVQITYRALLDTEREGRWLFELGFEHAVSGDRPEIAPGQFRRVRSNGVFYRFSRYFGSSPVYVGGRAGMSRVRGPEDKSNLDLVLGLQAGVSLTSWLDAGVEAVAAAPGADGGQPADVRGVVTVAF